MYVQQVNRETARLRRDRFEKLRDEVRKGILPPLPDEMFRVHGLTFLLPDDGHPPGNSAPSQRSFTTSTTGVLPVPN